MNLRIGIVCYPSYGGSGVVATELGKQLARRGHSVHFISYDLPFRLREEYHEVFYHAVDLPSYPVFPAQPYMLSLTNKIVEVARYHSLDLLHVHYAVPHATAAYLAKQIIGGNRPKIITTLHGTDITLVGSSPAFRDVIAFSIQQSDGVTAVSRDLAHQTKRFFSIDRPIHTIYNFVDATRFVPTPSAGNRREKVMIHISNFRPVKRVKWVVKTFLRLAYEMPVRLVLVGDGPDAAEVRGLVQQYGMQSRVDFLGKRDQIAPLLQNADVLILPSEQEAFGLVALEAMACQVPVVASHVGGLPELIEDGKSGFLVPVNHLDGFYERTKQLLMDEGLRQEMGIHARRTALKRFSSDMIVDQYLSFYQEVMSRP